MKVSELELKGVFLFEPTVFEDERGTFFEVFRQDFMQNILVKDYFVQENESFSKKGVLRGLHYQLPPFAQSKLIRCVTGKILDVVVDIRKKSSTFGKHIKIELSGDNKKQLFIPKGFAHGFVTLSDQAIIIYKVDNCYSKESEASIRFDDKELNIDWQFPIKKTILSEKDREAPLFKNAKLF